MPAVHDVFDVGNQRSMITSIGFGTDGRVGLCWLCRITAVDDQLQTCESCREELAG